MPPDTDGTAFFIAFLKSRRQCLLTSHATSLPHCHAAVDKCHHTFGNSSSSLVVHVQLHAFEVLVRGVHRAAPLPSIFIEPRRCLHLVTSPERDNATVSSRVAIGGQPSFRNHTCPSLIGMGQWEGISSLLSFFTHAFPQETGWEGQEGVCRPATRGYILPPPPASPRPFLLTA